MATVATATATAIATAVTVVTVVTDETVAIVATVATTDEIDTETADARGRRRIIAIAETEMVMPTPPAGITETGSAKSDTPVAATVEATENGTVVAPAVTPDAMMMAMEDATAKDMTTIVEEAAVGTAATMDSANRSAAALLLRSAASLHPI